MLLSIAAIEVPSISVINTSEAFFMLKNRTFVFPTYLMK
jgi:hypothetical protein